MNLGAGEWAVALKAGPSLPLGTLADYAVIGQAASLDLIYQAPHGSSVDLFLAYSRQAYSSSWGAQPMGNAGLGLKLCYDLAQAEGITYYVGAGAGVFYNQRSRQVVHQPVLDPQHPVLEALPESSVALGLLGVFGGRYRFKSGLGVLLECNLLSLSLAGGTSDALLFAQPLLGLSYPL